MQPQIFISATSADLRSARDRVAKVVLSLKCLPVWQDIFGTEGGDLRALLREKIDPCQILIQLVGHRYGAEPRTVDPAHGRISYTQYEARHALQPDKKVIYLILDDAYPTDACAPEPEELRQLQLAYRQSIHTGDHVFHDIANPTVLENKAHGLAPLIAELLAYLEKLPWNTPPRAARFTGRAEQLQEVTELLAQHQRVALIGPGGMGKTALAAEVIHRLAPAPKPDSRWPGGIYLHDYYRQSSHAAALSGLLAQAGIHDQRDLNVEAEVRRILSQPGVLLYLEGCEKAEELTALLDLTGPAQVLITTRDRQKRGDAYAYELFPLGTEDGAQLLHYCARQAHLPAEAAPRQPWLKLAGELGGHPLALRLAGAWIRDQDERPEEFARDLRVERFGSWAQHDERRENLHHLFDHSAEAVVRKDAHALEVWFALALHAHAPVPLPVLCASVDQPERETKKALAALVNLSLAERGNFPSEQIGQTEPAWQLTHALLGEWGREKWWPGAEGMPTERSAEHRSAGMQPAAPRAEQCSALRSDAILRAFLDWWDKDLNRCFDRKAVPGGPARYTALQPHWDAVLRVREQYQGSESPDLSPYLRTVGNAHKFMGNYSAAEPLYRRGLTSSESTLSQDGVEYLRNTNTLAILLQDKGDWVGAEPLFRRALETCERTLGREHPNTLMSLNNLANLLADKVDWAGAEPLYRRALEAQERTLGPEHPDTLASLNNLALLLKDKGDLAGAEPLSRRALESRERTLGPEHPDTLSSLSNLALLLADKGDLAGAEPLYRRVLETQERTLGRDHPYTLMSLLNLADLLCDKHDYAEAHPLYLRTLEAGERTLGTVHPNMLMSLNNLAKKRLGQNDLVGAEFLYRRALEAGELTLGPEHPVTLVSLNGVADALMPNWMWGRAEPLYRRALAAQERTLGPEHPDTLTSLNNLAELLETKGDLAAALPLYERAVRGAQDILLPEHPDCQRYERNLAILRAKLADQKQSPPA